MKLRDIADMATYLEERCYCPGEIYDYTGFFFRVFSPDAKCEVFAEGSRRSICGTFVTVLPEGKDMKKQIVYIHHEDGKVLDCQRLDATDNNIEQIKLFMSGEIDEMHIDEYEDTNTAESLASVLTMCDAVMEV